MSALVPIEDHEDVFRRIPAKKEFISETGRVQPEAFLPGKHDITGLSVLRANMKTAEEASQGRGPEYYVGTLNVGEMRCKEIRVEPDDPNESAHAILPDMRYDNRKSNFVLEKADLLASELLRGIQGPFANPLVASGS